MRKTFQLLVSCSQELNAQSNRLENYFVQSCNFSKNKFKFSVEARVTGEMAHMQEELQEA